MTYQPNGFEFSASIHHPPSLWRHHSTVDSNCFAKAIGKLAVKASGNWVVNSSGLSEFRLAQWLPSPPDFSFYSLEHLRDMTGIAKPTAVSKDRSFAAVHPNFGFDTHRQCGCPSSHSRAGRSLRGAFPSRIFGPDFSRQSLTQPVAIPFQ